MRLFREWAEAMVSLLLLTLAFFLWVAMGIAMLSLPIYLITRDSVGVWAIPAFFLWVGTWGWLIGKVWYPE